MFPESRFTMQTKPVFFWKLLPEKTLVMSNEKTAPGQKSDKARITIIACTNGTGTRKMRPLVIGTSKNLRCFESVKLPVDYKHSEHDWMTVDIFKEWFHCSFVPQVTKFLENSLKMRYF